MTRLEAERYVRILDSSELAFQARVGVDLVNERIVFFGRTGKHSVDYTVSSRHRICRHFEGFCQNQEVRHVEA